MEQAVESASPRIVSGHAGPPPGQGPFITVTLTLLGNRIQSASYDTYPCPGCQACGSAVCTMVESLTIDRARAINHAMLVEKVGPLPRHRQICYGLALLALSDALEEEESNPCY